MDQFGIRAATAPCFEFCKLFRPSKTRTTSPLRMCPFFMKLIGAARVSRLVASTATQTGANRAPLLFPTSSCVGYSQECRARCGVRAVMEPRIAVRRMARRLCHDGFGELMQARGRVVILPWPDLNKEPPLLQSSQNVMTTRHRYLEQYAYL